jgi:hypothetical protein
VHRHDLALTRSWTDNHGTHSAQVANAPDRLLLETEGVAWAVVDLAARSVDLAAEAADQEAWITDQLAPRLLSHLGALVVHAGAIAGEGGRGFLVTAPSGFGKSTLTAFLHQGGWPVLGDDAAVLRVDPGGVAVRAVHRRLKLRSESWRSLFPAEARDRPEPGRKVGIDLGPPPPPELPLAAIFCIGERAQDGLCRAEPLPPAAACLELLRNSFALDPTDRDRAARRLQAAGEVANAVPAFRLTYPRDFARLPDVRELIAATLAAHPSP